MDRLAEEIGLVGSDYTKEVIKLVPLPLGAEKVFLVFGIRLHLELPDPFQEAALEHHALDFGHLYPELRVNILAKLLEVGLRKLGPEAVELVSYVSRGR